MLEKANKKRNISIITQSITENWGLNLHVALPLLFYSLSSQFTDKCSVGIKLVNAFFSRNNGLEMKEFHRNVVYTLMETNNKTTH